MGCVLCWTDRMKRRFRHEADAVLHRDVFLQPALMICYYLAYAQTQMSGGIPHGTKHKGTRLSNRGFGAPVGCR